MILGTLELNWLGGDCPPGGLPTLAARLPWLRRTLRPAAAGSDGGGDGASAGGGGGFASPPSATALWEAQAALCGVKCGAPMPPPRPSRSAAAFRHEPRVGLHQGYTKTDGGDASEGELVRLSPSLHFGYNSDPRVSSCSPRAISLVSCEARALFTFYRCVTRGLEHCASEPLAAQRFAARAGAWASHMLKADTRVAQLIPPMGSAMSPFQVPAHILICYRLHVAPGSAHLDVGLAKSYQDAWTPCSQAADEAPPNGDAADAAVAPEAGTEAAAAAAAAAAAQSAAEAEAAAPGAAAAHNALAQVGSSPHLRAILRVVAMLQGQKQLHCKASETFTRSPRRASNHILWLHARMFRTLH